MENELPEEAIIGLISALEDVKEGRYTILTNQTSEKQSEGSENFVKKIS